MIGGGLLIQRLILLLIIIFIVSACNGSNKGEVISSKSWAYDFVVFNNVTYKLTDQKLKDSDLGGKLGVIETKLDSETGGYRGTYTNAYEIGTEIFSIKDKDISEVIAIKVENIEFHILVNKENEE